MTVSKMAIKATSIAVFFAVVASAFVTLYASNAHHQLERHRRADLASFAFYLATTASLILCLYTTLVYPSFISPLRHIPRAKRWLPRKLYSTHILRQVPIEVLSQIAQETPKDGLIALREPTGVILLVTKPSVLAEALISRASDFEKPKALQGYLKQLTLDGLLVVSGEQHKSLKKRSLSHFNFRAVKNLYPLMWRHALHFANAVEADFQGTKEQHNSTCRGIVELADLTTEITVNVIGTTVFGRAYEANNDETFAHLRKLVNFFMKPAKMIHIYLALTFYSPPWVSKYFALPMYKAAAATSSAMERVCLQLIDEKRDLLKTESQNADLASLMIKSGQFTDHEIASQLLTYLVAGQETTAATINWICYLLARDQRRQRTLRAEIKTVRELFINSGADVDIGSTLEGLPFLNAVINETLRLYPTVPLTQRIAVRDTSLAGFHVPTGTFIYISPWLIHRSHDIWGPTADQFCPERWLRIDENGEQKLDASGGMQSNLEFSTFLHGPRNCIGQGFAKAELRCLTAALAISFEWSLDIPGGEIPMRGLVTINPQRGLPLYLKSLSKARKDERE